MYWPRAPLVLAAAAFAAALVLGARTWQAHFRTEPVLRVTREVPAGAPLDPSAVEVVAVPLGARPPGALASPSQVQGRWARVTLVPGEYLLEGHTTPVPPPRLLAQRTAPGARVLSIPVRPEAALQGALRAGDRVDAYAAFPAGQGGPRLLAAGVRVMDVRSADGASIGGGDPAEGGGVTAEWEAGGSAGAAGPGRPLGAAAGTWPDRPARAVPAAVLLEVTPEQAVALLEALAARAEIYLALAGHRG